MDEGSQTYHIGTAFDLVRFPILYAVLHFRRRIRSVQLRYVEFRVKGNLIRSIKAVCRGRDELPSTDNQRTLTLKNRRS